MNNDRTRGWSKLYKVPCRIISPDICSVTLEALSETMPPIWFNVNIDYLALCQILFHAPGGELSRFLKMDVLLGHSHIIIKACVRYFLIRSFLKKYQMIALKKL